MFRHVGALDRAVECWRRVAKGEDGRAEADEQIRAIMVEKAVAAGRYRAPREG